ncbi:hypothetical protein OsJ_20282 [Oryza sativa Japonica Group]|uniref:Uncharacterized protein n=1 Tax=Oryza sativa subsp. japonica TaxID=39947 RepID=B9FRR3_ORYSJ|nr:hypothetical protein OsJ_20282 [Oryza sativa Japonica Group]
MANYRLVLLRSMRKYSTKMLVCNPATKELAELPACAPDYFGVQAVGFYADQSTGKTKVVHCFIRHCDKTYTDYSVGCEVLSLGSPAWRPLADPPYLVKTKTSPSTGSCTTPGIVRFDMCSEEFASFPCPPFMERQKMSDIACGELTELGGKLCYVHAPADDRVELWTASAADGGGSRPRWSLQCTVTKVVHCFIRHCDKTYTDYSVGCEVLSLGSPAWRPLADPPYLVKTKTSPSTGSCTTPGIVRFDMCSEEFASFPCPPFMERQKMSDIACGELTELGGKLCYVHAPADDRV